MTIADPQNLLSKLDSETYARIENSIGPIERFLKPVDKLKFSCDKSGKCCKNRFSNPIMIFPYDVHRLRQNLEISSREFASKYGKKILGAQSDIPMMLLNFQETGSNRNKCIFLRSYGCKVYKDRPLVCRLYPVGRFIDTEMNSFFFLTKTPDYCGLGKGKEFTIEEWLKKAEAKPFSEWNNKFHELTASIDHQKYKSLNISLKAFYGDILYDLDNFKDKIPKSVWNHLNSNGESGIHASYQMAKRFINLLQL